MKRFLDWWREPATKTDFVVILTLGGIGMVLSFVFITPMFVR